MNACRRMAHPFPMRKLKSCGGWIEQRRPLRQTLVMGTDRQSPLPEHPGDPVDGFLQRGLDARQLQAAPRATRSTLARRVAFDLTGLPPTPAQLEAFLTAPDEEVGWSKLVDELLDSPRYAERWARHWLDLVRYAETHGHEFDYGIPYAWRYRDSVIKAFEENVPWDRMIAEHLAGDLLPNPRIDASGFNQSELATGFWWFTQEKHGPTDVRAEESDRVSNQIDVMSKAFLGVTAACARCHDHKFDAISAEDYAALSGLLRSSRRAVGFLDPNETISQVAGELELVRQQEHEMADGLLRRQTRLPKPKPESIEVLFDCEPHEPLWFHDGLAFGSTTPADAPSTFRGRFEPAAYSMLDSGRISEKLQGATRSPSYQLTRPYTWVRVRGTGTIRQMVDGYWMNEHNALLFEITFRTSIPIAGNSSASTTCARRVIEHGLKPPTRAIDHCRLILWPSPTTTPSKKMISSCPSKVETPWTRCASQSELCRAATKEKSTGSRTAPTAPRFDHGGRECRR